MPWFKFSFTDNEIANSKDTKATDDFIKLFSTITAHTGIPKKLALFSGRNRRDKNLSFFIHLPSELENTVKPYLLVYSAVSCDKPFLDDIGLLFGVQGEIELSRKSKA